MIVCAGMEDESIEAAAFRCRETDEVGSKKRLNPCSEGFNSFVLVEKPSPGAVLGRLSIVTAEVPEERW
jgi:hypothetical protein